MTHYDTIIIGAGMSGLAAGIRLAMFDKKVLILEKHYVIGGLNSFYNMKARKFDVGLHAVTNYVPKGTKGAPLSKLFRQLRLPYEAFDLKPQNHSKIIFPDHQLTFTNQHQDFLDSINQMFPRQIDGFQKLIAYIQSYDNLSLTNVEERTAKQVLPQFISDPLLIDMLLCPLTYYGSAIADDMQFDQFVTMYQSIFFEGFSRPDKGVRTILNSLKNKYKELGGEIKLRKGVASLANNGKKITQVITEDGEEFFADNILSSAGYLETAQFTKILTPEMAKHEGQMTFMESISCIDQQPSSLGFDSTIIFYSTQTPYQYQPSQDWLDTRSGVICCPNNYHLDEELPEGLIRITNIANFQYWENLKNDNPENYQTQKKAAYQSSIEAITSFMPDFRKHVVFKDIFTPHTIHRYTWHRNGAVYGSQKKIKSGLTDFENLFLCGTDQGFLGIIGSMLSGVSIANMYLLK